MTMDVEVLNCVYCDVLCSNEYKTSSDTYICKSCWDIDIDILQKDEVIPIDTLDEE
jgi:hypothetical protein